MNEIEKRNDVKIISITNHSFVNSSSNKVIQIIGLGNDEKLYKRDQNLKMKSTVEDFIYYFNRL